MNRLFLIEGRKIQFEYVRRISIKVERNFSRETYIRSANSLHMKRFSNRFFMIMKRRILYDQLGYILDKNRWNSIYTK